MANAGQPRIEAEIAPDTNLEITNARFEIVDGELHGGTIDIKLLGSPGQPGLVTLITQITAVNDLGESVTVATVADSWETDSAFVSVGETNKIDITSWIKGLKVARITVRPVLAQFSDGSVAGPALTNEPMCGAIAAEHEKIAQAYQRLRAVYGAGHNRAALEAALREEPNAVWLNLEKGKHGIDGVIRQLTRSRVLKQ